MEFKGVDPRGMTGAGFAASHPVPVLQEVWVIETGEYEQRGIFGIAISVEAAIKHIKEVYGPPYRVRWGELIKHDSDCYEIGGRFADVPDYACSHTEGFEITRYELH